MARISAIGLVAILIVVAPAAATPIPLLECWMQVGTDMPVMWLPEGVDVGDGTFDFDGMMAMPMWEMTWDMTVKPDPFTDALIGISNPTGMTQTYTFTVVLPVSPVIPAPTLHGGSVAATLLDANFDGSATMGVDPITGQPMYMGMFDGVGVLPLLPPDVSSLNVTIPGGVDTASQVAGLPGPTLPGGAVNSTIAIQHKFTLTPGDNGTFNSFFVVVPEPATWSLLAFGALMLSRRRR